MSIGAISNLPFSYLESLIGLGNKAASPAAAKHQSGTAPFKELLQELDQLQQSNPKQHEQVTSQISASLHTAARAAKSDGLVTLARQLSNIRAALSSVTQS